MSVRGEKNSRVAVGGNDGNDHNDRGVLAARYEAMVHYRGRLQLMFIVAPLLFFTVSILTAVHFTAAGLAATTRTFMWPFGVQLALQIAAGVGVVAAIRLPTNPALRYTAAGLCVFLIYFALQYAFALGQFKTSSNEFAWYAIGAAVNAMGVAISFMSLFYGHMLSELQNKVGASRKKAY